MLFGLPTTVILHAAILTAPQVPPGPSPLLYLTPDAGAARAGETVVFSLQRGLGETAAPEQWGAIPVETVFLRAANTQQNADSIAELLPPGSDRARPAVPLDNPGTALLGVDFRPRTETIPAADLRAFLAANLSADAAASLAADLPLDGPVRVRRLESVKALVEVGPLSGPDAATATSKTGQPAEIRLLMNPAARRAGSDLPVRIYAAGDKRAGVLVRAQFDDDPAEPEQAFTTDSVGIGRVHLTRPGRWRAAFVYAERAAPEDDAALILYSSSVTFFMPEGGAPAAERPGEKEERQ